MAIDESALTNGRVRKLNALRKSVGDALGDEVFRKCLARQSQAAAPRADPVAQTIAMCARRARRPAAERGSVLSSQSGIIDYTLGRYGYTIRRARGKGLVATKNAKAWPGGAMR